MLIFREIDFTEKVRKNNPKTIKKFQGEVDGVSYHYVDKETIEEMIQNDEFIEHATFSNNTYGTSKAAVKTVVEQGKICILDIVSVKNS